MKILNKLFGKKQKTSNEFSINVTEEGIEINSRFFSFPVPFKELTALIGEPDRFEQNEHSRRAVWDKLGLNVHLKEENATQLTLHIGNTDKREDDPATVFSGQLTLNGEDYRTAIKFKEDDYLFNESAVGKTAVVSMLFEETKDLELIMIYKKEEKAKKKPKSKKYTRKKINGKKIEFKDFNLKLAVIEELMYHQELLKPKFDIHEFAQEYDKREIDVRAEGDEPIPEAVAYFKHLEIDQKLAEHITEIYQDGGNNIYMNIAPYWDGEDETFYIQSYEDLSHFPNLKKMTLFGHDPAIVEILKARGIDVKSL